MPQRPDSLTRLVTERGRVLDRIIVASRQAEIGALLLIGSLGRGGGDAWSDLDLVAVARLAQPGLDLTEVFGAEVLATVRAPRNAPIGGDYLGLCLEMAGVAGWVDWYVWPQATAQVPADATPIYDDLGLSTSDLDFVPLIEAHSDPTAPASPVDGAAELMRVAVAAKYLTRGNTERLYATMPEAQGLPDAATFLRHKLAGITEPGLARAVAATDRLLELTAGQDGLGDG